MHPDLFHLGRFAVPTYGVLAAAGLILGLITCVRFARREGLDEDRCWNLGVVAIFAGILGAKLLLLVTGWTYYSQHLPEIFSFNMLQTAGVWYGGLVSGVLAGTIYVLSHHMPVLRTADAFSPGIAFGHSLGRLGCVAAGCCYGKPTDVTWGLIFRDPRAHSLTGVPLNVRLHPTQIYEWAAEFAVFLILVWLWNRRRFAGQIAGAYLFLFGVARFIIEFWRNDPERGSVFGGALSGTQLISVLLVILGGVLWLRRTSLHPEISSARA